MKKSGFSMIELVFVIVILGVLAAVAVPRFVTTRTDAQVAMLRSDMASVLKAIPARIFAENIDPTAATPPGFNSWAEWMIDTGGLDRGRWIQGTSSANTIVPVSEAFKAANAGQTFTGCGPAIEIQPATGNLIFNPNRLNEGGANNSTLCTSLRNSYPSGSNRIIPLATTGAVKF